MILVFPKRLLPLFALLCFLLAYAAPLKTVQAQSLNMASGQGEAPLEILADNGIEWQQNQNVIIASGNAIAKRGDVTIYAGELRAYYRPGGENTDGENSIYRLEALEDVRIVSPTETATGDRGVYDLDRAILVLTGSRPTLVTPETTISASQSLEYWEERSQAVARGNAVAESRDQKRVSGDVLAALFVEDAAGKTDIDKVNAFGNVQVVTPDENIRADNGTFDVKADIVTLTGAVKIQRGKNLLNGCSARVNLRTNVSNLQACKGTGDGRVRGLVLPTPQQSQ